jgi:membrane protease YdiL (CAAX protease family)
MQLRAAGRTTCGNATFMLLANLVVATLLAWKLVGLGQTYLRRPTEQRAWLVGAAAGVVIVGFIGAALAAVGALKLTFEPNFLLMVGNAFSNFYEEYIYRGALLAILMKYLGNKSVAVIISALVFCQGHLHFPLPLLFVVFLAGLLWGAMVLRYQSIWPAWLSHCVMDFIADSISTSEARRPASRDKWLRAVAGRAGAWLGSEFASSWAMSAALRRALQEQRCHLIASVGFARARRKREFLSRIERVDQHDGFRRRQLRSLHWLRSRDRNDNRG